MEHKANAVVNFSCKRKKNYCGAGGEKAHVSEKVNDHTKLKIKLFLI